MGARQWNLVIYRNHDKSVALCASVALLEEVHHCGVGFEVPPSAEETLLLGTWKTFFYWLPLDKDEELSASSPTSCMSAFPPCFLL